MTRERLAAVALCLAGPFWFGFGHETEHDAAEAKGQRCPRCREKHRELMALAREPWADLVRGE